MEGCWASLENCPKPNPNNEKAPEMFNHFRGLVVFNNGGEIGIRTLGTGEGTTDFESVSVLNDHWCEFLRPPSGPRFQRATTQHLSTYFGGVIPPDFPQRPADRT